MAASLRLLCKVTNRFQINWKNSFSLLKSTKRYFLSETYSCNDAWNKYLQDPTLKKISLSDFAYQIQEQLQKDGMVSAVDINVLAHQFQQLDEDEAEFMEDILAKFSLCQNSLPRCDATYHAIVYGYLAAGLSDRLPALLTDRLTYGIFPNHYTLNLLLDYFIKHEQIASAAKISYLSMLQEDFTNPITTLLSLYATVNHLLTSNIDDLALPPVQPVEGEEEKWIKVKYIKFPHYDDHFDIKDERFLLGKTLLYLAKSQSVSIPKELCNSLKVIGSGLYHKFTKGLEYLESIANSPDGVISQHALNYFTQSLEKVEARDPNEPEVEIGLRTIDDVIHRLLPTTDEKLEYQTVLSKVEERLKSSGKVVADYDLGQVVKELVVSNLAQLEPADISAQLKLFDTWTQNRKEELEKQVFEYEKNLRIEEMKVQIKELKEKEEILTYFDNEEKLRLKFLEEDLAKDKNLTISQ